MKFNSNSKIFISHEYYPSLRDVDDLFSIYDLTLEKESCQPLDALLIYCAQDI